MGAINYQTGDFVTLSPYGFDVAFEENDEELSANFFDNPYKDDYANVEYILEKYVFNFYKVEIVLGYYEGFCLPINKIGYAYFDDYTEKLEALKETKLIKKLLLELIDLGLVCVCPGWCTTFYDRNGSLARLKMAFTEMIDDVKKTPTYRQYRKGGVKTC